MKNTVHNFRTRTQYTYWNGQNKARMKMLVRMGRNSYVAVGSIKWDSLSQRQFEFLINTKLNMHLSQKREQLHTFLKFVNIYCLELKKACISTHYIALHITQKLKTMFFVHNCNKPLLSSDGMQTMKTNFKPLKKFPELLKCVSFGDNKSKAGRGIQLNDSYWRDIPKGWVFLPGMIFIPF